MAPAGSARDAAAVAEKRSVDPEILNAARYWQQYRQGPYTLAELAELARENGEEIDNGRGQAMILREEWLWHWADSGFTTFRASPTYAAALMVTDPPQVGAEPPDLIMPWQAIRVEVPAGVLVTPNTEVRWIYVKANVPGDANSLASLAYSNTQIMREEHHDELVRQGATFRVRCASTLADVLWYRTTQELEWLQGGAPFANEEKERLLLLCANYVSGLLYTLQHTRDWSQREHRNHWRWSLSDGPRPPPNHRNVVCGRPITVNLRDMVHAQARGETRRSAPSMFQACVRGHYKRQVIGVGRSGRKVIWVEPYWRGPEGAPLLVRPYNFTG